MPDGRQNSALGFLRNRRNFVLFFTGLIGFPFCVVMLWLARGYEIWTPAFILYVAVVSFATALIWALLMWTFFMKPRLPPSER